MAGPTIPGYQRLSQIGKGGFSRVYKGEQSKLKRQVAIKVLNFGLNDDADRASFERECELMGRVSTHPNIVTVHDTEFTTDGQPCIVMEHYPGGSLADLIGEVRQLNPKEVLEVGVAIAAALEASHQAGVLHCDLKPQNILISEFGQPALGDFGISTFTEERTRTGGDAGAGFTLAYAAPEIVEGASPSVESDLYSLAATLYTSLAGRRPFYYPGPNGERPTAAEQARRILLEEPAPLTDSGVPKQLDALIREVMSKEPSQRPSTAAAFAQSLYRVGQGLGFGTSMPRIADQGALPVFQPSAEFTDQSVQSVPQRPPASPADSPVAAAVPAPARPAVPDRPPAEAQIFSGDATQLRANGPAGPDLSLDPTAKAQSAAATTPHVGDDATELRPDRDLSGQAHPATNSSDAKELTELRAPVQPRSLAAQPEAEAKPAPRPGPAPEPTRVSAKEAAILASRPPRRVSAAVIGVLSLVVVTAVVFLVSRGGESASTGAEPTVTPANAAVPDVVLAPPAPRAVVVSRVGSSSLLVSWSSPVDPDVSYEIRRTDQPGVVVAESDESPVLIRGIDATDAPCIEVVAERSNLLSPSASPTCTSQLGTSFVETTSPTCELPCDIELVLVGIDAESTVEISITTLDGQKANFDDAGMTSKDGEDGAMLAMPMDDDIDAGIYLVSITTTDSDEPYLTAIEVTNADS